MIKIPFLLLGLLFAFLTAHAQPSHLHRPIPAKTIVLTFDDAVQSQYRFVAPLLKHYHFGATFYVCEFPKMWGDTANSMDWGEIKELSAMGFEIGNHTWHHTHVTVKPEILDQELTYIEKKCDSLGLPRPTTFAYPGYTTSPQALPVLRQHGYLTARTGGDRPYDIGHDDPLLIPAYTIKGDDSAYFYHAIAQATEGQPVVFCVHGVPDIVHPWVTTPPKVLARYLKYLHDHHYHVVPMRELGIHH